MLRQAVFRAHQPIKNRSFVLYIYIFMSIYLRDICTDLSIEVSLLFSGQRQYCNCNCYCTGTGYGRPAQHANAPCILEVFNEARCECTYSPLHTRDIPLCAYIRRCIPYAASILMNFGATGIIPTNRDQFPNSSVHIYTHTLTHYTVRGHRAALSVCSVRLL